MSKSNKWLGLLAGAWIATASIGCDKPTAAECKKAINNIRTVLGTTEQSEFASAQAGWVRSCRGSAKRKAVKCAIDAKTLEALTKCGLISAEDIEAVRVEEEKLKAVEPKGPTGTGTGSAAGTGTGTGSGSAAGSGAATGSDAGTGSGAATGSDAGTDSGAATGSGTGTGTGTGAPPAP